VKQVSPKARSEKIPFNNQMRLIYQIWYRNWVQFCKSWMVSFVWIVIEPLFMLSAIGYGLGTYVSTIDGVSYVEFFYPALICSSAMFVAYFVSTYDNFSKLSHLNLFSMQILSPIEPQEIVIGEILWAATKGTLSAVGVSIVASFLGLVDTWKIFPAIGVVFISSLFFASFGMLVTTYVRSFDQIIYPSSCLIIPMSLFSGTYFPIDHLPYGLNDLAYLFPLTHTVRVVRLLLTSGAQLDFWVPLNILYVLALTVLLTRWSTTRLTRILLN
jgi:lipooligosaccharide transport system permease protein